MLKDFNPTTRMYPRTLSDAFKQDCEYANSIEIPEKQYSTYGLVLSIIGLCIWFGLIYFFFKY